MTAKGSSADGARQRWSSRFAFLMATIGAAVGLGNLWRFPFQTGENGGAAFVLIYLLCVVFIAYPVLIGEIAIGRRKGLSALGSIRELAKEAGHSSFWAIAGLIGIAASYLVLTTYSVVAGQILSFSLMSFMGVFAENNPDAPLPLYSGVYPLLWFSLFLGLTMLVVARGLQSGIERLVTTLMPVFFLMLAGLSVYALATGAAGEAIDYLFAPRFSELSPEVVLAALGQAFYSVAVGTAGMITYGAYLDKKESIALNSAYIVSADTLVAIVSGLMIFPIVFSAAISPDAGMGLIFETLPAVFMSMPAGSVVGGLFYFLAFIAALTSSIIMLLVAVVLVEEWLGLKRLPAVFLLGAVAWIAGTAGLSVEGLAETIDYIAGSILLPLAALLGAVFAGWIVPRAMMRDELHNASEYTFRFWRFFIRYFAPVAVSITLLLGLDAKFNFGLNAFIAGLTGG